MNEAGQRHLGKYRGTVVSTADPERLARLRAIVPDVLGAQALTWAMPAAPYAGTGAGFVALPPAGAGVWIEFEQGDLNFPIWSGGWWGSPEELPAAAIQPGVNQIALVTPGRHAVTISDLPGPTGGVSLVTAAGARIMVSDNAIVIDNGQGASITLAGDKIHITGAMV